MVRLQNGTAVLSIKNFVYDFAYNPLTPDASVVTIDLQRVAGTDVRPVELISRDEQINC